MISNLVSILMPTVRVSWAVNTIRQTLSTTLAHSLEYIVIAEQKPICDAVTEFFHNYERSNLESFQVLYQEKERGPIQAWNDGLRASKGEFIAFWSDDLWPYPSWLDIVMSYFDQFPGRIGLVGLNDLVHNANDFLATHNLVHRQYVIQYQGGVLAYPCYRRICSDAEAWERAKTAGLGVWAEEAIVEHLHPMVGKRERDRFDDLNLDAFHNRDFEILEERRALGFPDNFEPVITE